MRTALALVLLSLVALTGCLGLSAPGTGDAVGSPTTATNATNTTGTPITVTVRESGAEANSPPDPESDRLGWEAGYWHNESIAVDNSDGMNESERGAAVARAMARVEYVRGLEFRIDGTIPITVRSRASYRNRTIDGTDDTSDAARLFDNGKFEAMFLVGEGPDSMAMKEANRAATVQGYYSPTNDSIVLISGTGKPQFDGEKTLAQEVGHALQDLRFNLTQLRHSVGSRDALNGQNGLVEGDGNLIDERYAARCGDEWECIPKPPDSGSESGGGAADVHLGINMLRYFPYSDGPPFIEYYYERGGWDRINGMYDDPPVSAEQIIYPEKYPEERPTNVTLRDTATDGWTRVRPPGGTDHATLGQSALTTMFAYTWLDDDYRRRGLGVVRRDAFLNLGNGTSGDIFDYDIPVTSGWDGDALAIYHRPRTNETGYVWRIAWDSRADAREFVDGYGGLLRYWGGQRVDGRDGVWRIDDPESPFTDAFAVRRSGRTVTVVNAPTVADLGNVSAVAR